jgi:hypothetical protein
MSTYGGSAPFDRPRSSLGTFIYFLDANFWRFRDLTCQRAKSINFWLRNFDFNLKKISMTS